VTGDRLAAVRALVFDLQGTTADFFRPIVRAGRELDPAVDWGALLPGWRRLYRERLTAIAGGTTPWVRTDRIYREGLDTLLAKHNLADRVDQAARDRLNQAWERLDPWPDSVEGLARLRRRYVTSPLTNDGMATAIAVAKHAGLPFDAILSTELARTAKPAPAAYQLAVDYLGFPAEQIMLVACHKYDLRAAREFGMRTAFVTRPDEFGPDGDPDTTPEPSCDLNVSDFVELADELGC
jgi:2-haloacid dehalogenase